MGEIATGYGNEGNNASGVGAYIFNSTVDPLTLQLHLNDRLQQAQKDRLARGAAHLKTLDDMAAANDLDTNGIRPYDADTIKQQASGMQDAFANYLKTGGNLGSPEGIKAYSDYKNSYNNLMVNITRSKDANSKLASVYNTLSADKGDKYDLEKSNANYAQAMGMSLDKVGNTNWPKLLVPNADTDINGAMNEWGNTFPVQQTSQVVNRNGFIGTETTDTKIDQATVDQFGKDGGWRATKYAPVINNSWDQAPLTLKSTYVKQAADLTGDATLAPTKAVDLYAWDLAKKQQSVKNSLALHGETEASKQAAKKSGGEYAEWPHMVASVATGDPDVMGMINYSPPLTLKEQLDAKAGLATGLQTPRQAEVYGTTTLNNMKLGDIKVAAPKFDKDGNPIPGADQMQTVTNHPTIAFTGQDGKTMLATVESEENYRKGLQKSPYVGTGFNSMRDLLYYLGTTVQKSGKEEGLDPLTSMMAEVDRVGARGKDGSIDEYKLNPLSDEKKKRRAVNSKGHVKYIDQSTGAAPTIDATDLRTKYNY